MAVRLAQVLAERKTLQLPVGDDVLNITYRVRAITPATQEAVADLFAATSRNGRALATWVAETVTAWDLLDGDGKPLGLDVETLVANVPIPFLEEILTAVAGDMTPGEAKSGTSDAG